MVSTARYIREQATIAAIFNVVLNPLAGWMTNRGVSFVPFASGFVIDVALTSVIMSVLVALFSARGVHQQQRAGAPQCSHGEAPRAGPVLQRLPRQAWLLGLLLGLTATFVVGLATAALRVLGVAGLPFWAYLVFKAVYCGCLAFAVARWVILRQLVGTRVTD